MVSGDADETATDGATSGASETRADGGGGVDRRRVLAAVGAAGTTAALAGCGGNGGTGSTTSGTTTTGTSSGSGGNGFPVTITQGSVPSTLDPQNHRKTPTVIALMQAYEKLLSRDQKGNVQAGLATDWKRVTDGHVRFTLRDGVTFHSGNAMTAADVAFSINRIVQKDVGGIASPQGDQLAGVTRAEAGSDGKTVDVYSDGVNPLAFPQFASYGWIMEKQWVQNHDESYIATHINGTGPFELDQYEQDVRLVYKRNENYYQDPAAVTKLTFDAASEESVRVNKLVTGETDVTVNVSPQDISRVNDAKGATIDAVPSTRTIFNAMRHDVEPFSAPKFREALNYAVDLQSIVKNVLSTFGDETSQPGLQGFTGFDSAKDPYPHDPSKAESLVKQSGHDGASITLHVPTGRYLKGVEIAQAVASQIDSLSNVSCEVKQRDFSTLAGEVTDGKIETSPHFYLLGWGNATFDSSKTITPLLTSNGPLTTYSNDELDSLIESAGSQGDATKRDATLQDANDLCHDQTPWIFLNRQYSVYGASKRIDWQPRRDERIDAYSIEQA